MGNLKELLEFFGPPEIVGECWNYKYARSKTYPCVSLNSRAYPVIRCAYMIYNGIKELKTEETVWSVCKNKFCFNPAHIFIKIKRKPGTVPPYMSKILITGIDLRKCKVKRTLGEWFWDKVDKSSRDGCWPWKCSTDKHGYGSIGINGKQENAHRCAYALTYGQVPLGKWVLHRCDNPPCCRPNHLFLGDAKANSDDKILKLRLSRDLCRAQKARDRLLNPPPAAPKRQKITDEQATEIQNIYKEKRLAGELPPRNKLAIKYGISKKQVNRIAAGYRSEWTRK